MIPNIVFITLRYVFLGLLFLFLIIVVRAIYRDVNAPVSPGEGRPARRKKKEQPHILVVAADRNIGAKCYLSGEVRIGRAGNCQVVIDDTYASQQHARVYRSDGGFFVEDLGSTNGTYVNGRKISYPLELRQGDRIKIGKTVFEFRA